jgi:hypothetical protein
VRQTNSWKECIRGSQVYRCLQSIPKVSYVKLSFLASVDNVCTIGTVMIWLKNWEVLVLDFTSERQKLVRNWVTMLCVCNVLRSIIDDTICRQDPSPSVGVSCAWPPSQHETTSVRLWTVAAGDWGWLYQTDRPWSREIIGLCIIVAHLWLLFCILGNQTW